MAAMAADLLLTAAEEGKFENGLAEAIEEPSSSRGSLVAEKSIEIPDVVHHVTSLWQNALIIFDITKGGQHPGPKRRAGPGGSST